MVVDHACRALGGEQQVHAEAAAALGDVDQLVDEVGQLGGDGRELVHDHEQPGEGLAVAGQQVLRKVAGARVAQPSLPVVQLGLETAKGAAAQVLVEVGDEADGVRQLAAGVEGAAALVVDEHEVEVLGADGRGEGCDEGAQQLALARSRRARHQAVGAVGHEVEHHRTRLGGADRRCHPGHGVDAAPAGEEIVGTGGLFPAAIVIGELTLEAPLLSVTWSRTVYVPGVV